MAFSLLSGSADNITCISSLCILIAQNATVSITGLSPFVSISDLRMHHIFSLCNPQSHSICPLSLSGLFNNLLLSAWRFVLGSFVLSYILENISLQITKLQLLPGTDGIVLTTSKMEAIAVVPRTLFVAAFNVLMLNLFMEVPSQIDVINYKALTCAKNQQINW